MNITIITMKFEMCFYILKGGGRIFKHLNYVSNTYFHELLGGLKKNILSFDIQLILHVPAFQIQLFLGVPLPKSSFFCMSRFLNPAHFGCSRFLTIQRQDPVSRDTQN